MASEVTIPRLGWNMDEGTFIGWLKEDGERVAAGESLFSLEGDKATQDVESIETGILRIPPDAPAAGAKVTVGTLIGYLVAPGEPAPFERNGIQSPVMTRVDQPREGEAPAAEPEKAMARPEPCPPGPRLRVTPRARRVANELGVDLASLRGSGKTGRIVERDIRAAAGRPRLDSSPGRHEFPVTSIRRTIAERMLQSAQTTAGVTLSTTIDATNLVNLRQQFKAVADTAELAPISFTDIVVKLTALALGRHPLLRGRWNGDKIAIAPSINIGIAVDTDPGLLVPVLHDVPGLTLRQLAARSRDLIERARRGALSAADMQGGAFTVTNLGAMGIDMFTPIINLPECAILGMGRIHKQVVVEDKQFVARDRIVLSLTFDHRIVDGAPAAHFLQSLGLFIENPSPWLLP